MSEIEGDMSRYRIHLSHRETCICTRCQAARRKVRREAERPRRLPAEDLSAELVRLRAEGSTYRQLGEATGLSVGTVHRLVRPVAHFAVMDGDGGYTCPVCETQQTFAPDATV